MKLAIAGAGMIVRELLSFEDQINNLDIVGIYARNKNKASDLNINLIYDNYETMLKENQADTIYIALPNILHFEFAKKAILAGKHVIMEKPFTINVSQAAELYKLSKENQVIIIDAVNIRFLPSYYKLKEAINQIGEIKIINCNFSQYSSRYDRFKNGDITPVFDHSLAGGALLDINIYNIDFVVGLFGIPETVLYSPNIENKVDTSGILLMDYGSFKAVCIGAKDCKGLNSAIIQGEKGYITVDSINSINSFTVVTDQVITHRSNREHRLLPEFRVFVDIIDNRDFKTSDQLMRLTLKTITVMEEASSPLIYLN